MALRSQSLILYNYQITALNCNLDFKNDSGGPELTAVIDLGQYSLTSLMQAIVDAMQTADPNNTYVVTADRTIMGGLQNRVTIKTTTGTYLSLLFGSGSHVNSSISSVIGFNPANYTGILEYTGSSTTGSVLIPTYTGYNYLDDKNQAKVFGSVNVSAAGVKEAVVFNIQKFVDVEFKYEAKSRLTLWQDFWNWAIQQRPFDFTPEILDPTSFFQVTLEKTAYDGRGLGFQMKEMLPNFPNFYQTGNINMRIVPDISTVQFIT